MTRQYSEATPVPTGAPPVSTPAPGISGKLLIIAVVSVAFAAAGAGWWFRYSATHRTAAFWGSAAVQRIREAPQVTLINEERSSNVSRAPGLTHLRTALMEDRSFDWPPPKSPPPVEWKTRLEFRDGPADNAASFTIAFSSDHHWAAAANAEGEPVGQTISCQPIAAGIAEVFTEWTAAAPSDEQPATSR